MLLKAENISADYKNIGVLRKVNIAVEKNTITTLIGVNGAGKSTLVKALMGIVPLQEGIISYKEKQIEDEPVHKRASEGISLCPEGRQLFPKMTVLQNLELGAFSIKSKQEVNEMLNQVYDMLPKLKERSNQKAGTLSGGEQEMVSIGRALMAKPELLILDEPSWGLAPKMVEEVMKIAKEIKKTGTTILLVEQNANSALKIADYAYVLDIGEIVLEGTGKSVREDKQVKEIYIG